MNSQINIQDVPQELLDMVKQQLEADPRVRDLRIRQNLATRSGNIHEAMAIGKAINGFFARAIQNYLVECEQESKSIDLGEQDLPKKDASELVEIVVTLFLAADIIDTATQDFNDVLHRSDDTLSMEQFDDMRRLAKAAKAKMEYFRKKLAWLNNVDFGEKSDNMYEMLRNKARAIIRKAKDKKQ